MSVRVSLTTTANELAPWPKTVEAATTDDMSLMAVPAQRPNECGDSLKRWPRVGNVRTATTLKVKMVAMA